MRKILFTKNILGNDRALFDFVGKRFDVLVASIAGTHIHNIGRILGWTHEANTKLYVRSQFIHSTSLDVIMERAGQMISCGVDGLVFQGQTTEDKVNELMLLFLKIAEELSRRNVDIPVVFMVDSQAGAVDLIERLKNVLTGGEFTPGIDIRTAVRVPSQNIQAKTRFPKADLVIIDFNPFDTAEKYTSVDLAVVGNSLDVVAYMTYDIMSSDLKEAIQRGYEIPSREIQPKNVTVLHDLTLRSSPSGQIIKRPDGSPLIIKTGLTCVLLQKETKNGDTWYQVETVLGITGWIAGEIGGKIYAS